MTKKISLSFLFTSLIFGSIFIGQTIKLNLSESPRISLLFLDGAMILFIIIIKLKSLVQGQVKKLWLFPYHQIKNNKAWQLVALFLFWALISLLINTSQYSLSENLTAFSYWLRLFLVAIFSSFVFYLYKNHHLNSNYVRDKFIFWGFVTVIAGFVQLIYLHDFSFMTYYGWDPHQNRLLSTFYDPNFFGLFIVLLMSILSGKILAKGRRWYLVALFVVAWLALYLTYSRSAWLAGTIALPIIFWPKNRKLSITIFAIFVLIMLTPNRLNERVIEGGSFFSLDIFSSKTEDLPTIELNGRDPSATARSFSLKKGWEVGKENWLAGVGYNAYGFALRNRSLTTEGEQGGLSSQGSDSSLLNVFVTTGVVGLMIFLSLLWLMIKKTFSLWRGLKMGGELFGFSIAYLLVSFFNNSLFYNLILVPFIIIYITSVKSESQPEGEKDVTI